MTTIIQCEIYLITKKLEFKQSAIERIYDAFVELTIKTIWM